MRPRHEEQRDEHGDERHRERDDREADLLSALQGRLIRLFPLFDVSRDVLDHDDRVVDDEARRDRQRREREIVEAVPEQVHHAERADERERNRDGGDGGGAQVPQKAEDDEDDQADRDDERDLDVFDGRTHGLGAVAEDGDVDALGKRRLQTRKELLHAVGHVDDVRARLAHDIEDDGAPLVRPGRELRVLDPVLDGRDVREAHRGAVLERDDDRLVRRRARELVVRGECVVLACAVDVALRLVHVRAHERGPHVFEGEAGTRERARIDLHAHGRLLHAVHRHETDAGHLADLLREDRVGDVVHLRERERVGRDRNREHGRVGRVRLRVGRRGRERLRQQVGRRIDGGLDILLGRVDVSIERELQRHLRLPECGDARHLRERGHLPRTGARAASSRSAPSCRRWRPGDTWRLQSSGSRPAAAPRPARCGTRRGRPAAGRPSAAWSPPAA